MDSKTYALICLILSFASFLGAWFLVRKMDYTDDDTKEKCDADLKKDTSNPSGVAGPTALVGKMCHVWDGKQCRRGTFKMDGKNLECEADGNKWPLVLLVAGVMLLMAAVFFFVKQDTKEVSEVEGLRFRKY